VNLTIPDALQRGILFQNQKQYDKAQAIYEKVLEVDPKQPDALHLLGLLWSARGEHLRGAQLIREAIKVVPSSATFLGNLGVVLKFGGKLDEAVVAYEQSIAIEPNNGTHYFHMGKSLKLLQRFEEAERAFRKAIEMDPGNDAPWLSLIRLVADTVGVAQALSIAEAGAESIPRSAGIRLSQASLLRRSGDYCAAINAYQALLSQHENHVEAMCKLASLAFSHHHFDMGQPYLARAQQLAPESHHVLATLALLQNTNGNSTEAIRLYRQAIAIDGEIASYHANVATALRKQGRLQESLDCIEMARALDKDSCDMDVVEAGILLGLGEHDQAIRCLEHAICERKGYREAHDALLMALQYRPGITSRELFLEHKRWGQMYCPQDLPNLTIPWDGSRPIRVGLVSADLGLHPVGYFSARLIESLDPKRVEVMVYSDRLGSDPLSDRLAKSVKKWTRTEQWNDDQLLESIRNDSIEVLFDLAGHTAQNRLMVFGRRAAPIQISWAGYVGTTGVPAMDYVLGDPSQITPAMEEFYTEKVLRMPHDYITYLPPESTPDVNELPMLTRGYPTFGALCNPSKVNGDVLKVWGELLTRLPDARLILSYSGWPDQANRERVQKCLLRSDLFERIEFRSVVGAVNAMSVYHDVDIALDTFPYSGGLTTIEAMWMGVPTVTIPGETFAGRHSFSHLATIGLQDWVANNCEQYLDLATQAVAEPFNLDALRKSLRGRVLASPMCDGIAFATRLMEALELLVSTRAMRAASP
jgi:protein O-GlcNAc transferase